MTVRATLWKYEPRKDGTCNIKLYISHEGKKRYEKTPYYALPDEWDSKLGRLKKKSPLASKINSILKRLETEATGKMLGISSSLIQFIADYVADCQAGREELRPGTWKKFIAHRNKLRAYAVERGLNDIGFEDINLPFYADFTKYLRETGTGRSGDTNQEANWKLKTIATMAGTLTNMADPGGGNIPKSSMVTTHTARRSAATNLLLSGVPLSEIMQLGGWKFEATLKQYLLAGGLSWRS